MLDTANLFDNSAIDTQKLAEIAKLPEPKQRYCLAITPRSGSSYLCDVMSSTHCLGRPGEFVNQDFIPDIIKKIPGRDPEEYLRNTLKSIKSRNGLSGFKTSWFQWHNFYQSLNAQSADYISGFKYIYLTRRNITAQAVSLYRATASTVFHTNIEHSEDAMNKWQAQEYDYQQIKFWHQHILEQELGWQQYFYEQRIFPLCLTYEEIETDIILVLKRIAKYLAVDPKTIILPKQSASVFEKVSDERNIEWTHRFYFDEAAALK